MNWKYITSEADIFAIAEQSQQQPCLIFKHSTRCPISSIAKLRLENDWSLDEDQVGLYFLDLIQYRAVSQFIAEHFSVAHESPQVLLIRGEECIYDNSHLDINMAEIEQQFQQV